MAWAGRRGNGQRHRVAYQRHHEVQQLVGHGTNALAIIVTRGIGAKPIPVDIALGDYTLGVSPHRG